MKSILTIILVMSFTLGRTQSVDYYLEMASENNPGLKARYAEYEAALQQIPQVQALPDPTVSVSAFGRMIETRVGPQKAIFTFNQMFPWFGTLKSMGNVAALTAEAKFHEWLDARNELFFQVKASYYPLFELEQMIKLQQENKKILETFKTLVTTQFKNGKGSMVDVVRVDIMLEDINTELKVLEQKKKPLLAMLNKLLNREQDTGVAVADSLAIDFSLPVASADSILQNNPKLSRLEITEDTWDAQADVARKEGLPSFGVGLNYTIIGMRTDLPEGQADMAVPDNGMDAIMPMISFSLPIYRKKYRASVREAQEMQKSASEMRQEVANELLAAHSMAWFEKQKAVEEFLLFETQTKNIEQAVRLLISTYSNSGQDFEEVLRMQQLLLRYQIDSATALKDYFIAVARLDYLAGKGL